MACPLGDGQSFDVPALSKTPAVVFEDQSKASERISHAGIVEIVRHWQMPRWLIRGLLDQVVCCAVRAGLHGKLGAIRLLLRGIGTGGTANALIWNMGGV